MEARPDERARPKAAVVAATKSTRRSEVKRRAIATGTLCLSETRSNFLPPFFRFYFHRSPRFRMYCANR